MPHQPGIHEGHTWQRYREHATSRSEGGKQSFSGLRTGGGSGRQSLSKPFNLWHTLKSTFTRRPHPRYCRSPGLTSFPHCLSPDGSRVLRVTGPGMVRRSFPVVTEGQAHYSLQPHGADQPGLTARTDPPRQSSRVSGTQENVRVMAVTDAPG